VGKGVASPDELLQVLPPGAIGQGLTRFEPRRWLAPYGSIPPGGLPACPRRVQSTLWAGWRHLAGGNGARARLPGRCSQLPHTAKAFTPRQTKAPRLPGFQMMGLTGHLSNPSKELEAILSAYN
jgi:hypothetical protein